MRFAVAYAEGNGKGHVQSLILGAVLFIAAVVLWALGVIGDLLAAQRVMTQRTFERVRRIELQLGVAPSHYERGCEPSRSGRRADEPAARGRPSAQRGGAPVSGVTVSEDGIVTGNTYDKYGSTNPVVRRLMAAFERTLDELMRARRAALAARRRLRRGRARAPLGAEPAATRASSASTSRRSRSRRAGRSARRRTSNTA